MAAQAGAGGGGSPAAQAAPTSAGATAGHMIPINGAAAGAAQAQPEPPHKMEVKPELKGNEAKRARLSKGNVNDASMASGLINHINKEGGKAGMGS